MQKHKFASISLTVRDRAIMSKFSTHRVSQQTSLANFQKNLLSSKMVAILNFRIFAKNAKTQICFYLLNHVRQSSFVGIFDPYGNSVNYTLQLLATFPKNHFPAIFGGHLEFLRKMQKRNYLGNGAR